MEAADHDMQKYQSFFVKVFGNEGVMFCDYFRFEWPSRLDALKQYYDVLNVKRPPSCLYAVFYAAMSVTRCVYVYVLDFQTLHASNSLHPFFNVHPDLLSNFARCITVSGPNTDIYYAFANCQTLTTDHRKTTKTTACTWGFTWPAQ
jgi:hypothetical protein